MKVSLVVTTAGKGAGQTVPITLSQFLIGRDAQCNLRPASAVISKRHCAILVKGTKVYVRDFDSTNGTFVNDKQVKGECQLKHDDLLRVGPLQFRVVIETSTAVNKPTPPPPKAAQPTAANDDESVAAMLLALQDDGSAVPTNDSGEVPAGSTVMDVPPPGAEAKSEEEKKEEKEDKEEKPDDKTGGTKRSDAAKQQQQDTRAAAAAILEKYTRRQRT